MIHIVTMAHYVYTYAYHIQIYRKLCEVIQTAVEGCGQVRLLDGWGRTHAVAGQRDGRL